MLSIRTIWIITIVMLLSLLGIMWLQFNWLNWNIELSKSKFNNNVYSATNKVAQQLSYADKTRSFQDLLEEGYNYDELMDYYYSQYGEEFNRLLQDTALIHSLYNRPISAESQPDPIDIISLIEPMLERSLSDRIDLRFLDERLKIVMENFGLPSEYQYGVYDKAEEGFIIQNGHYVFPDKLIGDKVTRNIGGLSGAAGENIEKSLFDSRYRVNLFPSQTGSPGMLVVSFKEGLGHILGDIWQSIFMSFFFIGLMLFSFIYVIRTIFKQKRVSEMKTDFINNMTHEFKTPIATISLAADSITSPVIMKDESKIKRFAQIIKQENKRMHAQVEKVLQMAMIDKRNFDLKLSEVNMHVVIKQITDNVRILIKKRNGSLTLQLDADKPIIEGDLTHLQNIIYNLLDNANKYSPDNPEIKVATKNNGVGIEVAISDNGVGMNKEARKYIFDKFYRVSTGNLHDVKGFGLGLSYVKAIVTAHKGEVFVESELGKGSCFKVSLPYRQNSG